MRQQVFFTLYDDVRMRQASFDEAKARAVSQYCPEQGKDVVRPNRVIRIEMEDDGDGLEIKSAEFVTEESLRDEAECDDNVLCSMRDEMMGDET